MNPEQVRQSLEELSRQVRFGEIEEETFQCRKSSFLEQVARTVYASFIPEAERRAVETIWKSAVDTLSCMQAGLRFDPAHRYENWAGEGYFTLASFLEDCGKKGQYGESQNQELLWKALTAELTAGNLPQARLENTFQGFPDSVLVKLQRQEFVDYCENRGFATENGAFFREFNLFSFATAGIIAQNYEVGVCLARGGLYTAFLFSWYGFSVMDVEMKRKGTGASWLPRENFLGSKLESKKVLILEEDYFTGGTLRRAVRELERYKPRKMGVCFYFEPSKEQTQPALLEVIHRVGLSGFHFLHDERYGLPTNLERQVALNLAQTLDEKYHIFAKDYRDSQRAGE